jgi:uncharacterized protein with PIN domain
MSGDRDEPHGEPRFILDGSLGKLARNLRMFGLDAELMDRPLKDILFRAFREKRWVLTRRTEARQLKSSPVPVMEIRDDNPESQLIQVLRNLSGPVESSKWFWRCLVCNTILKELLREEAVFRVPEHVAYSHESFRHCPKCGRIYWPGSHRENMLKSMERWAREAWGSG